jgi:hypothetical protein
MAIPAALHGSEAWTLTARDTGRIHAAEMRFLRAVKGCARHDRLRNEDIRNELGVEPIQDKLSNYRENWKTHLRRMPEERIPTQRSTYCGSTLEEMELNVRPELVGTNQSLYLFNYLLFVHLFIYSVYLLYLTLLLNDEEY